MKKLLLLAGTLAVLFCAPPACADSLEMKPVITGFIDMQVIAWHNTDQSQPVFTLGYVKPYPGLFGGIVLNATWNEMQPNSPAQLVTARIDNALAQVRAYDAAHPDAPLFVKLRIFSGNQAPTWAEKLAGGPVKIQRNPLGCHMPKPPGCPITIGKVWDPQYITAWRAFQMRVARRYDLDPLIRSVAITSCAMETDEPFVMPVAKKIPRGYTDTAERACLAGAIGDYAGWRHTAVDYTFNTFIPLEGARKPEFGFTLSVMNACRARLPARCELGNHAFSKPLRPGISPVVDAIAERKAPIHYQTVAPDSPTLTNGFNWRATMRLARTDQASAIELWPLAGGFTTLSFATMKHLHAVFEGEP
ncbi:MAG: hypothetical protein WBQ17_08320 [Rhizomicrobium sp.]